VVETTPGASKSKQLRDAIEDRLAARDRAGAVADALDAVDSGQIDIPTLYAEVLAPLLRDLGSSWQHGRTRVWEEHFASATVRTLVEALYGRVQAIKSSTPPDGRSVLLACPVDERHDLGLRMLSDLFDLHGWTTYLLGADTPTRQIGDAATALEVDLVLLASTTLIDRVQVRHVLDSLHDLSPGVRVVVAGCAVDCEERGLRPDEVFRAEEFFEAAAEQAAPESGD
jgi:MerR family transcriptional regulator, light-induced transcriptional regulator